MPALLAAGLLLPLVVQLLVAEGAMVVAAPLLITTVIALAGTVGPGELLLVAGLFVVLVDVNVLE